MEKILFTGENGEQVEFFVIEEAKLNGTTYLLVTESEDEDDEEAMAYIMKQVAKNSDKDLTYEFVEDEKEIEAVAGLLEELLDGEVDLVPEED
ncbi:MAG: DUF1292 domain-containing protein [Lachnospiraceae bacterium]|nr:DUF1292 domain-containing protein [Lachnospiraceae bacterium]MBO4559098.1 DUF1292 domain-containing protein [Lachnospiraceae bacterium]